MKSSAITPQSNVSQIAVSQKIVTSDLRVIFWMKNYSYHQKGCPYSDIDLVRTASDSNGTSDARLEYTVCPEYRCCIWQDLQSWFGFKDAELKQKDFHFFFTDVAHGGSGVYEKFIVSGQKTLEVFGETYIKNKFELMGIPSNLLEDPLISEKVCQKVWTLKRVERLLSSRCISTFAKAYLAVAQILFTDILCVKYVKACIGYSCHLSADDPELIIEWLPTLIEHMYFVSRLHREDREEDNELLLDIQEYFDYPYTTLTSRIREIVSSPFNYVNVDASRGENLIRQFSKEYFMSLANEAFDDTMDKEKWTQNELDFFMDSPALELFSTCWLSLPAYFARDQNIMSLPHSMDYRKLCGLILETCYELNTPEESRVWIMSFIHRLRQIQIILELNKTSKASETSDMFYFNKEILKYDHQKDESIGHSKLHYSLHDNKKLETFKDKENETNVTKEEKFSKTELKTSNIEGCKTIICTLGNMLIKYLTSPSPPKPEPIIATGANGKLFELKPVHSFYKQTSPPPYLFGSNHSQDDQHDRRMDNAHIRYQNSKIPKDSLRNDIMNQKPKIPCNESVFTRNVANVQKYQSPYINKSNEQFQRRRLFSCKSNLWNKKFFDKEGEELWRPPAAIFMQKRKKNTFNNLNERNIPRKTVYDYLPLLKEKFERKDTDLLMKTPKIDNFHTKNRCEETSEDNIKLKIRYIVPEKSEASASSVPLNVTVNSHLDDTEIHPCGPGETVLESDSDSCESESSNKHFHKRHYRKLLYSSSDTFLNEINVNLVPIKATGSPNVYVKKKTKKQLNSNTSGTLMEEIDCCCDSFSKNSCCSHDSENNSLHETTSLISDYSNCDCCCCCCCNDSDNDVTPERHTDNQITSSQMIDCNHTPIISTHQKNCDTRSSLSSASTDSYKKSTSRSDNAINSLQKRLSKLNKRLSVSCEQAHSSTCDTTSTVEIPLLENHLENCTLENQPDSSLHQTSNVCVGSEKNRKRIVSTKLNSDFSPSKINKAGSLRNLKHNTMKQYKEALKAPTTLSSATSAFYSSSQTGTSDSSRTGTSGSSETETFHSSQTSTFDSSRTGTSGSSETETFHSSQTSTFDSSRTGTSGSSETETFHSSQTAAFDSSRTGTSGSSETETFHSSQTATFDSSRTGTSGSSETETFHSSQTATSDSSRTPTLDSSSQQTSTTLSHSSAISGDLTQIASSCCSPQSLSKSKFVCHHCDDSSLNNYLEKCTSSSQSDTCRVTRRGIFSNDSPFHKTSLLSTPTSASFDSLNHAFTTSETDSSATSTNTTTMSSDATLSSTPSALDLPRKHRELLNQCRKLSQEISGIVSKFDEDKSLENQCSSKHNSKTDSVIARPSNTHHISSTDVASNTIRAKSKKQNDKDTSPTYKNLASKHLQKSVFPSNKKSFEDLSDIFPTMFHDSKVKKRNSTDSDTTNFYSNSTQNTRSLARLLDTKKELLNKFSAPSYTHDEKGNLKREYHGLKAVYHDAPSVSVFE